jgi:hypothetical protein
MNNRFAIVHLHGVAEHIRHVLRCDGSAVMASVIRGYWRGGFGAVLPMVLHTPDHGLDWATQGIITQSLDQFIIVVAVLLRVENI